MCRCKLVPSRVRPQINQRPVVEAGALKIAVLEREAERADQMEPGFDCRGEARDRAGILRNFRANQNDVKIGLDVIFRMATLSRD